MGLDLKTHDQTSLLGFNNPVGQLQIKKLAHAPIVETVKVKISTMFPMIY